MFAFVARFSVVAMVFQWLLLITVAMPCSNAQILGRWEMPMEPTKPGVSKRSQNWIKYCGEHSKPHLDAATWQSLKHFRKKSKTDGEAFIRAYTAADPALHKVVNSALYKDDAVALAQHGPFIRFLRRAIEDVAKSPGGNVRNGIVWRGMELAWHQQQQYSQVGARFLWPGFTSASRSIKTAQDFGNTLFRINLEGEGLTYAIAVRDYSEFPSEDEVLMYPYSGFEITSYGLESGKTVVGLKTVDTLIVDKTVGATPAKVEAVFPNWPCSLSCKTKW